MWNTPSTVHLQTGDHKVRIAKQGFKPYEKTLTVSGGNTTLNAALDSQ